MAVNLEQFRNQVTQAPCVFGRFVVTLQGDDLDSVQAALICLINLLEALMFLKKLKG